MTAVATNTITVQQLLAQARQRLTALDSGALDAEILLAHALHKARSYLHTWPEAVVPDTAAASFEQSLRRRLQGEPVAYLTGQREFWSLQLQVDHRVLVPRPDTERLVELALEKIPAGQPLRIADLGTGSGAIALALATERPRAQFFAVDMSRPALDITAQNIRALGLRNVEPAHSHWCEALQDAAFDVIVSNPPYIAEADPHLDQDGVRFEPRTALAAGPDGLDDYHALIPGAFRCLQPGGWLLLEHGHEQQTAVLDLLARAGFVDTLGKTDDAGQPRVCMGRKP